MKKVVQEGELDEVAQVLIERMLPSSCATIVTLSGELGSGKTAFSQAIARSLGVTENVMSPTLVIERIYNLPEETTRGFERLIHIDAYRLEGAHELESLGWKDIVENPRNVILIEWPEKVSGVIPRDAVRVTLSYVDDRTRYLAYDV